MPLLAFNSHIAGQRADVQIRLDQIQWAPPGGDEPRRPRRTRVQTAELAALVGDPQTYFANVDVARSLR